ncbi:MAG: SDR family NAD(P)-dependent oxidoreductase [Pseudomonadota bacterium]
MNTPALSLHSRIVLVTGAGQGLGRATALALATRGATVVLLGRTIAKLETVYDAIVAAGGPQPAIFPMDLEKASEGDFETLAQTLHYQLRRLDGIVHCAAAFEPPTPLAGQSPDHWPALFKTNVIAPFAINRACQALLSQAGDATVILVGESHGHQPAAYWGGFAVSKAALETYFMIQAEEWPTPPAPRLHLVIPGPLNTPQRAQSHPGEDKTHLPGPETLAEDIVRLFEAGPDAPRGLLIEWHPGRDVMGHMLTRVQ